MPTILDLPEDVLLYLCSLRFEEDGRLALDVSGVWLLHICSHLRKVLIKRVYSRLPVYKLRYLTEMIAFFQEWPHLAAAVRSFEVELMPDVHKMADLVSKYNNFDGASDARMPKGIDVAFMDRNLMIQPSRDYVKYCKTPCWHPSRRPKEPLCQLCLRAFDGEDEYPAQYSLQAPEWAIKIPDLKQAVEEPDPDSEVQMLRLDDIRRLLTYRHQLGAGVDEDGLDPNIRNEAELTQKLVELAELLPSLETLRWACTFAPPPQELLRHLGSRTSPPRNFIFCVWQDPAIHCSAFQDYFSLMAPHCRMLNVQSVYFDSGALAWDPNRGGMLGITRRIDPVSVHALDWMILDPQASALYQFLQNATSLRHLVLPLYSSWILQAREFWPLMMRLHHIEFYFEFSKPGPLQNAIRALRSVVREVWLQTQQPLSGSQIQDLAKDARLEAAAFALQDESIAVKVAESWNSCKDKGPNEPLRHPRAKHSYAKSFFGPMTARWEAMVDAVDHTRSGTTKERSWMPPQVPANYLQRYKLHGSRA